jgi:uncharacterized protein (TIGR03032 family)
MDKNAPRVPQVGSPARAQQSPFSLGRADFKVSKRWLEVTTSEGFAQWLAAQGASIALTTYQGGKLIMVGLNSAGRLSICERTFTRCMGLWSDSAAGQTLWVATLYQLWRLENSLLPGQKLKESDRLYVPREGITTGNLDVHDLAQDINGRLVFVNTLFSCLATVSSRLSFAPLWQPPFISSLRPDDRCHLNGLAMEDGRPAYVTSCSTSDTAEGWRQHRRDGGCLIDVRSNQILLTGLSMPHSPRVHEGRTYLHNSGSGYFGYADIAAGAFVPITFCPGYLRGMTFTGGCVVVGVSKPRDRGFAGLQLDDELRQRKLAPLCGLQVLRLCDGEVIHWLRIEGLVGELYEVVMLPTVRLPALLGFKTDEIHRTVTMDYPEAL